ncbi:hypothetical protein HNQ68_000868 [Pseudochrobactrum saccharolyticum]|uniref:Uncharacterized protein n=1 Tax=Pseudochrobactrum saccharolyticum TaxID=354352 RepID=A0A7W8AJD3_9HYPH|nr:hypothetical protein [Pseudochrobactrum saccharolyticum]
MSAHRHLQQFQEKWKPVFRPKLRHKNGNNACVSFFDTGLFSDKLHTAGTARFTAVLRTHIAGLLALALILK